MEELSSLIFALENKIPFYETENKNVSSSTVGWHLQHSLLVINGIIKSLEKSNPQEYKWAFNYKKTLVLISGKIPRGVGKAPKSVQPTEVISKALLAQHIKNAKDNIILLIAMHPNQYFLHPYFGQLNLKPTIKFLKIHTRHHLHIVNDIMKEKQAG